MSCINGDNTPESVNAILGPHGYLAMHGITEIQRPTSIKGNVRYLANFLRDSNFAFVSSYSR